MLVRFQPVSHFFNEIDSIINSTAVPFPLINGINRAGRFGGVSVKESADQVQVCVELPGIAKQDVHVSVNDGILTISAERREPELKGEEQWIRNEISYGKIERTVELPYSVDVEKVSAEHENGILQVILPKHENAKPKQISIR
jgi:HSP20 family protein